MSQINTVFVYTVITKKNNYFFSFYLKIKFINLLQISNYIFIFIVLYKYIYIKFQYDIITSPVSGVRYFRYAELGPTSYSNHREIEPCRQHG